MNKLHGNLFIVTTNWAHVSPISGWGPDVPQSLLEDLVQKVLTPERNPGASGKDLGSHSRLSKNTAGLERPQGLRAEKFPEAMSKS